MTALQQRDIDGFYSGLWEVGSLIAFVIPVVGAHRLSESLLRLRWRAFLTRRLAKAYLAGDGGCDAMFYRLHMAGEIDNPDQRICQDAQDFVATLLDLVTSVAGTLSKVLGFAGVLYAMSPGICAGLMGYVVFGTAVSTGFFTPRIMRFQLSCRRQEATLRYCLIRTRENAESVAFFRGGGSEWVRFQDLFCTLLETIQRRILLMASFGMFRQMYFFATFAVAPLAVGPAYLRGELEFGAISQAQMAFSVVLNGLSVVIGQTESLSALSVQVSRLDALERAMHREVSGTRAGGELELQESGPDVALEILGLTVQTPPKDGCPQHTLVRDLSLCLARGQSALVVGQSGIGKSSLLRAVAGLWQSGSGTVRRALGEEVFFMPQHPYMFLGTLEEQLLYPSVGQGGGPSATSAAIVQALCAVGLGGLLGRHRLQDAEDWSSILSLGERQRINFARILLRPSLRLAIIDEGTSACDGANEALLYQRLAEHVPSYVSVGHRAALRKFHTHVLWLRPGAAEAAGRGSAAGELGAPAVGQFSTLREFEAQQAAGQAAEAAAC